MLVSDAHLGQLCLQPVAVREGVFGAAHGPATPGIDEDVDLRAVYGIEKRPFGMAIDPGCHDTHGSHFRRLAADVLTLWSPGRIIRCFPVRWQRETVLVSAPPLTAVRLALIILQRHRHHERTGER